MMFGGRRSVTMILAVTGAAGLTAVAGSGGAMAGTRPAVAPRAAALNGTWRTAREIPGTAALNRGGHAQVNSVSCSSPGNCSAGGWYTDRFRRTQAFVVSEVKGTWHTAIEVPRTAALHKAVAEVSAVSCASAGNCSIGGSYYDSSHIQAFVGSEVNGIWRKTVKVPGTAALNKGDAQVSSVSCRSAGNCSAGGWYTDSAGYEQPMVVNEVNRAWHNAIEVPGTAALNKGDYAQISSVSCGSAGNCSAGGWYMDSSSLDDPLVVSEVNGAWHNAIRVPGMTALTRHIFGMVTSVSCGSAGNCSAGGWDTASSDLVQPFVAREVHGAWPNALKVPRLTTPNRGGGRGMQPGAGAGAGQGIEDDYVGAFVGSASWSAACVHGGPVHGPGGSSGGGAAAWGARVRPRLSNRKPPAAAAASRAIPTE